MRALLIVNPRATSTTPLRRDVIARALASELDLEVVETRYRGHAAKLAASAAGDGFGVVLTLGGDGTVNEAVNGLMGAGGPDRAGPAAGEAANGTSATGTPATGTPATGEPPAGEPAGTPATGTPAGEPAGTPATGTPAGTGPAAADSRPALAAIPGGSANVFSRALGLPTDPVDATGRILDALSHGRCRRIGVGQAASRYFALNAGLGFDAEVVRAVEGLRADGVPASAGVYLWTAIRHFFAVTDRRHPALTLERPGREPEGHLFFGIVSNAAPWTFLGSRPLNPSPEADFGAGLDLFAVRKLTTVHTLDALRRMLSKGGPPRGRGVLALHDEHCFTIRSERPIAFQLDGEYVGEVEQMTFRSVPDALRVIA